MKAQFLWLGVSSGQGPLDHQRMFAVYVSAVVLLFPQCKSHSSCLEADS